jgi:biopolymer transport protein ExbD
MSMQVPGEGDDAISQINTTPLVDVMLVLLIIFLITIPVVTTSVQVSLPQENNQPRETKPANVIVSVNAQGQVFIYDTPIKTSAGLIERMRQYGMQTPQPEVEVRGDAQTRVEHVGQVLYAAQLAGIAKVGFITEPRRP